MQVALRPKVECQRNVALAVFQCDHGIIGCADVDVDAHARIAGSHPCQKAWHQAIDQTVHRQDADVTQIDTLHLLDIREYLVLVSSPPPGQNNEHFARWRDRHAGCHAVKQQDAEAVLHQLDLPVNRRRGDPDGTGRGLD